MYKQVNNTCEIDGCTNETFEKKYCHYHRSILNRICAYYYHKELIIPVEWCGYHNKSIYKLDCENCDKKVDPKENIEIIKKLLNLNQGGKR